MRNNQIPLYVLNGFLKFERKLYQVFGLSLGRPIRFKTILYAIVIGVFEIVLYITPIIGSLIRWIPVGILIVVPFVLAWLLSDIGTEDRSPLSYFRSFFLYQIRKLKGDTYYRNREVQKEREYSFNNYLTFNDSPKEVSKIELEETYKSIQEQQKALRYFERITEPDEFFARMKQEQEKEANRKKRRRLFFKRKEGA